MYLHTEQLHRLPGLQEGDCQETGNASKHVLFQSRSHRGELNRMETPEHHSAARNVDGAQCQVSGL